MDLLYHEYQRLPDETVNQLRAWLGMPGAEVLRRLVVGRLAILRDSIAKCVLEDIDARRDIEQARHFDFMLQYLAGLESTQETGEDNLYHVVKEIVINPQAYRE